MQDKYFEIMHELRAWIEEKLGDYKYSKDGVISKIDDTKYIFAEREKEGMAIVKECSIEFPLM